MRTEREGKEARATQSSPLTVRDTERNCGCPNALIFAAAPLSLLGVEKLGTQFGSEALARQAQWRHLVMHGLAQSKPSGQAQACTRQAPAALDGTTGLV